MVHDPKQHTVIFLSLIISFIIAEVFLIWRRVYVQSNDTFFVRNVRLWWLFVIFLYLLQYWWSILVDPVSITAPRSFDFLYMMFPLVLIQLAIIVLFPGGTGISQEKAVATDFIHYKFYVICNIVLINTFAADVWKAQNWSGYLQQLNEKVFFVDAFFRLFGVAIFTILIFNRFLRSRFWPPIVALGAIVAYIMLVQGIIKYKPAGVFGVCELPKIGEVGDRCVQCPQIPVLRPLAR